MGLKFAGMWLALLLLLWLPLFLTCVWGPSGLFIIQLSTPLHPQALKESLSSLHPAPPKEEALMPLLLLPQPLATAEPIMFCHACGSGKYSVAHAAAG